MTTSVWQSSLILASTSAATVIENGAVIHFGNPSAELQATANGNTLCDLSHLGLLEIDGADAVSFLQGQVTNDVKLLSGSNAHFSAYCTPKGRMLALFLAFSHHNHLHIQLNRELLEPIMKRLKMYVMRSQVNIKDVSESIVKFGLNGPDTPSLLAPLFAKIPTRDYELASLENGVLLKLPTKAGQHRFQIFTDATNASLLFDALKQNCQLVGKPCWDWLDIQAGMPDISLKTQEQFVPQMLNLDILNGINFKKGCYTGQEIVARTHYLGSVKRRMYLAELAFESCPNAGDKVLNEANSEVGQIVRYAPNLAGNFDVLAELRIESTKEKLFCNLSALTLKTQPYTLD